MSLFRFFPSRNILRSSLLAATLLIVPGVSSGQSLQFNTSTTVNTAHPPLYALAADINNDGFQDLVIVTSESNDAPSSADVFLGKGDGTFKPGASYVLGLAGSSSPGFPVLGQTRSTDTILWDLIVPMKAANSVNVLLGNVDGTFQTPTNYATNPTPVAVALRPLNSAMRHDLAVASGPSSGSTSGSSFSVFAGNGDGTFGSPVSTPFPEAQPSSTVWVSDSEMAIGSASGVSFSVFSPEGVLQPGVEYALSSPVKALASAHLNSVGPPYLAAVHDNVVSVFSLNGGLQSPTDYNVGKGTNAILILDLNGDDKLDLVVSNDADNTLSTLLGNGDGSFQPAMTFPTPGLGPISIQSADFNNDGAPDIAVVTTSGATAGTPGGTYVLFNSRGVRGTMSPSVNPLNLTDLVTFTAKLSSSFPGLPIPTGQVTFYFDFDPIGPPVSLDATGTAQITTGMGLTLPNLIRATYSGDKNYNSVELPPFVEGVVDLSVSEPSPASATVAAGETAKFTIPNIFVTNIQGPVDFSCSGAPPNSTCSVSPDSLPSGGSNPPPVAVSIKTNGPHGGNAVRVLRIDGTPPLGPGILAGIVVLTVAVFSAFRRVKPRHSWIMAAAAVFAVSLCSCGGGSGGPATPAGTYTITFTAKATTVNVAQSQNFILTVTK